MGGDIPGDVQIDAGIGTVEPDAGKILKNDKNAKPNGRRDKVPAN
jgi:hypothetical protein